MAIGTYATVRPATVSPSEVEIFYTYTPNRQTAPSAPVSLNPESVLTAQLIPGSTVEKLGGLYTLRLPSSEFNRLGIYTLVIRPRQLRVQIIDCGVLSQIPDQKGIILDTREFSDEISKLNPGALTGYRVEYLESNGSIRENFHTVVTWSNRCQAVAQNVGNTTQKFDAYSFADNASLLFLSVTPSSSPTIRESIKPFIGQAGQDIILTNPFFNPEYMEIELVEHDIESIATAVFGDQIRNVETGVATIYRVIDGKHVPFSQHATLDVRDEYQEPVYEIKRKLDQRDDTQNWDEILENVTQQ